MPGCCWGKCCLGAARGGLDGSRGRAHDAEGLRACERHQASAILCRANAASQDQMLALAFRQPSLIRCELFPLRSEWYTLTP